MTTTHGDSSGPPAVEPDLTAAACLFRGFGDPARLTLLRHLALGEHRVKDLTDHLGLAQSTVSAHLACGTSSRKGLSCTNPATSPDLSDARTEALTRRGLRLAQFT